LCCCTASEKGLLLSSFFWGYVAGQIPGSLLAQRFGAKVVFGLGIFLPTVLTFLTPLCAKNINLLYMVRSLTGLTEAVTFPALFHMLPAWTPRAERSAMVSFVMSGMYMGDILGFGLSGVIVAADAKIGALKFGGWYACAFVHAQGISPRILP
jgi:MFS family permease